MDDVQKSNAWKTLRSLLKDIKTYKDVNESFVERIFLKIRQIHEIAGMGKQYPHLLFICNLIVKPQLNRRDNFVPLKQLIALVSETQPDLGLPSPAMTSHIRWGNIMAEFYQFFRDIKLDAQNLRDVQIEDAISIYALEIAEGKEIGYTGDLTDLNKLRKSGLEAPFNTFIYSYCIHKRQSTTKLDVFFSVFKILNPDQDRDDTMGMAMRTGRCGVCGSIRLDMKEGDPSTLRCLECGTKHDFSPWWNEYPPISAPAPAT